MRWCNYSIKNQSALIIGGSRGIGEVTAKILAAGGANVLITYNKGKNDAEKVVSDINSHGGVAAMLHYDINVNEEIQFLTGDEWKAGNLSYHLKSRPKWEGFINNETLNDSSQFICVDDVCLGRY